MRRHTAGAPDARLDVIDFLLGQTRSIASVDRLLAQGVPYDPFAEFSLDRLPVDEFRALWDAHRPALVAEAARRGIALPDPSTYRPVPAGSWIAGVIDD